MVKGTTMRATITCGISSSGKTTWANEQDDTFIVCRDDVRVQMLKDRGVDVEHENIWSHWKFKREDENNVTETCRTMIVQYAVQCKNIIVADTNLNYDRRMQLKQFLIDRGYEVEVKLFDVDVMDAIKRDERRKGTVGNQVIYSQWMQLISDPEFGTKKYVPDTSKPKAVIFDVDGTLAIMGDRRKPYEWDKVHLDTCNIWVRDMANRYADDHTVIVLSGRDGSCYNKTFEWLKDNRVKFDKLFMRESGDMRKDAIIKGEIFWRAVADNYNVIFAVDDRPQMARYWYSIGVNVFAVGPQFKEF